MKTKLAILVMLFFSMKLMACSCAGWDNVQGIMDSATGVYVAIPMEDSHSVFRPWPHPYPHKPPFKGMHQTQMKIVKSYKGFTGNLLNVYHDPQIGTSCEFDFEELSGVYVIITYNYKGKQFTDMCSFAAITPNNSMVTNFLSQL